MEEKHLILLALTIAVLGRAIIGPLPFDDSIGGGADSAVYLMRAHLLSTVGEINWNPYWYGGMPFLAFYPPLSFYVLSFLGSIISEIVAFKLISWLMFLAAPVAFYYFLREFNLEAKETALAVLIFSFTMYYNAFMFFGQYPTTFAIPIALVFLKYFVRSVKTDGKRSAAIAALFLGAAILMQQIVALMAFGLALIYLLSTWIPKRTSPKTPILSLLSGVLISAYWAIPFFLESKYANSVIFLEGVNNLALLSIPMAGVIELFGGVYINLYTVILGLFASLLILIGLWKLYKQNKFGNPDSNFWMLAIVIPAMAYFLGYLLLPNLIPLPPQRFVVLWAIPLAVVMARSFQGKYAHIITLFVLLQAVLFIGMPMPTIPASQYTKFDSAFQYLSDKEGRISFQPQYAPYNEPTVTDYRPILFGLENEFGIFHQGIPADRAKYIYDNRAFSCEDALPLTSRLTSLDFLNRYYIKSTACKLVNDNLEAYFAAQYVKYVIADKNYPEVVAYFAGKSSYAKEKESADYIIYKFNGNSSFVDAVGLQSTYTKENGKISVNLVGNAQNAHVRLSETWYPFWSSEQVNPTSDKNGFISFDTTVSGSKQIVLEYKKPQYYDYFLWVSAIGVIMAIYLFFRGKL